MNKSKLEEALQKSISNDKTIYMGMSNGVQGQIKKKKQHRTTIQLSGTLFSNLLMRFPSNPSQVGRLNND